MSLYYRKDLIIGRTLNWLFHKKVIVNNNNYFGSKFILFVAYITAWDKFILLIGTLNIKIHLAVLVQHLIL